MRKKSLLIAASFGLFSAIGFSQNIGLNKANEKFKQLVKEGFDKEQPTNAKNTGVFIPEWRLTNMYNQSTQDFDLGSRNLYYYQNSNELIEDLVENYDNNASDYVPSYRTLYSKVGNWEITLTENWDAGQSSWYGTYVDSSEYNAEGDEILNKQWYYDINGQEWLISTASSWDITYDANGNATTIIISDNDPNGGWMLSSKENYTFDANGVITEVVIEEWNDNTQQWQNSMRAVNPVWHDQEEFLIANVEVESWDGSAWVPSMRLTSEYHTDNTIELELEEEWDDVAGDYVNSYKNERAIDAQMVVTSEIAYDWDDNASDWVISWGSTFVNSYNLDDELEEQVMDYWNSFDGQWQTNLKYIYSYIDIASTNEVNLNTVKVYPNPTSEKVVIEAESNLNNVTIYGMNGQVFYSANGLNEISHEIDVQFLNAGTYFVTSTDANGTTKSKLIIQ
jgi:hypothetical protein